VFSQHNIPFISEIRLSSPTSSRPKVTNIKAPSNASSPPKPELSEPPRKQRTREQPLRKPEPKVDERPVSTKEKLSSSSRAKRDSYIAEKKEDERPRAPSFDLPPAKFADIDFSIGLPKK